MPASGCLALNCAAFGIMLLKLFVNRYLFNAISYNAMTSF